MSKIEWTEETWNPVVGCNKVSDGCKHCYAINMANRLAHIPTTTELYMDTVTKTAGGQLNWTGVVKVNEGAMAKPFKTKKPTMFFVNSMSDLFHESLSFDDIARVYAVMGVTYGHTYQILTKRPERMLEFYKWIEERDGIDMLEGMAFDICLAAGLETGCGSAFEIIDWPLKNVWVGVSVENQKCADERIPFLLQVPAAVRFLSCEPLLGQVDLYNVNGSVVISEFDNEGNKVKRIDWVIAGGESGSGSRPMHPDWVRGLRDQCKTLLVPFFFKQWGDWVPIHMPHQHNNIKDLAKNEQWLNLEGGMGFHGYSVYRMRRIGKVKAPKYLDGFMHHEFPKV